MGERNKNRPWGGLWRSEPDATPIAELRDWHLIEAKCRNCGWCRRFSPGRVKGYAWHGEVTVGELDQRLKCSLCFRRNARFLVKMIKRD